MPPFDGVSNWVDQNNCARWSEIGSRSASQLELERSSQPLIAGHSFSDVVIQNYKIYSGEGIFSIPPIEGSVKLS